MKLLCEIRPSARPRLSRMILLQAAIMIAFTAAAGAAEPMTISLSPSLNAALFIVAEEKGCFADQGLKIVLDINPRGGNAVYDSLIKGKADLAVTSAYVGATQSFERKDFKIIATAATSVNDNLVVARRDAGISEVQDLRGKRVGVTPTGIARYSLNLLLNRHGLRVSDVVLSLLPTEESVKRLTAGDLDAACIFGTYVYQAKKALGGNAVTFSDEMLLRVTTILMAMDGTIGGRRPEIVRVLRALILAEDFVRNNSREALALTARRLGIEEENLRPQWNPSRFHVTLDQSLVIDLENMAQWQIDTGLSKGPKVPNFLDYLYFGGLDAIDSKRITVIR